LVTQGLDCGVHGSPGGQAIIYQDDGFILDFREGPLASIKVLPSRHFLLLSCSYFLDDCGGVSQSSNCFLVEHSNPTRGNRTHGEFLMPWDTQLANKKDIQGRMQEPGYFSGNRYASTRQCQHQHIRTIGVANEFLGKQLACFAAITIAPLHLSSTVSVLSEAV
jgi:hypothetical protein